MNKITIEEHILSVFTENEKALFFDTINQDRIERFRKSIQNKENTLLEGSFSRRLSFLGKDLGMDITRRREVQEEFRKKILDILY